MIDYTTTIIGSGKQLTIFPGAQKVSAAYLNTLLEHKLTLVLRLFMHILGIDDEYL